MLRKLGKSHRSRRNLLAEPNKGQAMVEMALVATILLMLTFGTADLGLFMYKYVQAANCTREAAQGAPPFAKIRATSRTASTRRSSQR